MFRNRKIMIVAAHPDDELLGVGATIVKLITKYKATVKVVILGEGLTARDPERKEDKRSNELSIHRQNILNAQAVLGYQELAIHQLPDNRFDSVDLLDIVKIVEAEKSAFKPDFIFTHHGGDLNIDHRKTFEAVLTATRPMAHEGVVGVLCFETFSATEWAFSSDQTGFRPNFFMPVSEQEIQLKQKAMAEYKFELRDYPHPRSIKSLEYFARANGSKIGHEFAESFEIVRLINAEVF